MSIAIAIIAVGGLLIAYTTYEVRVNQRACSSCGFRASKLAATEECPWCGSERAARPRRAPGRSTLVLIAAALLLIVFEGSVVLVEQAQPETERSLRLVKESSSRIENFTIQQYLYTTVYHRRQAGKSIAISGWRAEQADGPDSAVMVEFSFAEDGAMHTATWVVDAASGRVTPKDRAARDMSWSFQ
jgi:hypothetical protein